MTDDDGVDELKSGSRWSIAGSILLLIAFVTAFFVAFLGDANVVDVVVFAIAAVVMFCVMLSTIGNRITLLDDHLVSRDWLFRRLRIPYAQVERLDFRRGTSLTIRIVDGRTITWPARTPGMHSFIGALSERITRVRPLQISGDLEVE